MRKKDESIKCRMDYRLQNKVTIRDKYSLPRISDQFEQLRDVVAFSKSDQRSRYQSLKIEDQDSSKFLSKLVTIITSLLKTRRNHEAMEFNGILSVLEEHYFEEIMCLYGIPTKVSFDRDSRITSRRWQHFQKAMRTQLHVDSTLPSSDR